MRSPKTTIMNQFFSICWFCEQKRSFFVCPSCCVVEICRFSRISIHKPNGKQRNKKSKLFHSIYAWFGCRANVFVDANCLCNGTHIRSESELHARPIACSIKLIALWNDRWPFFSPSSSSPFHYYVYVSVGADVAGRLRARNPHWPFGH